MEHHEYDRMYAQEKGYWWFQGRKRIVMTLLGPLLGDGDGRRCVDLGCGTGLILDELQRRGKTIGVDFSSHALEFCRERNLDGLVRADVTRLPLRTASADVITLLDLAEHVSDHERLVEEVARTLRPGGHALFTVPAHPFLWSEHDESLWHKRRYTRRSLLALFEGQPLEVRRCTYAITFTFLPIVAFRVIQRTFRRRRAKPQTHLIPLPGWANGLLIGVLNVEAWLLRWMNLPFGVSLILVVRRDS